MLNEIYTDVVELAGEQRVNQLILLERAANQIYWAKKLTWAQSKEDRSAVIKAMLKQAQDYKLLISNQEELRSKMS